jgi:ABC-type Mn2+/Zn2+ transport system permease subunit
MVGVTVASVLLNALKMVLYAVAGFLVAALALNWVRGVEAGDPSQMAIGIVVLVSMGFACGLLAKRFARGG